MWPAPQRASSIARIAGARARPPARRRRAHVRAFTLTEVLTVIIIIGVLAAIASPSFIRLMRDRGVSRATLQVMDALRIARARSLEREAVLIRWSAAGGPGGVPRLEVYEALMLDAAAQAPTCAGTAWGPGSATSRLLAGMIFSPESDAAPHPDESGAAELAPPVLYDPDGTAQAFAEICFTARGKTFVRYVTGDPFEALTGAASIAMVNKRTGFKRTIFVPPNSPARVAL